MSLNWTDAQAIAQELFDTYPDLDPVTLRMTELHALVLAFLTLKTTRKRVTKRALRRFCLLGLTSAIN